MLIMLQIEKKTSSSSKGKKTKFIDDSLKGGFFSENKDFGKFLVNRKKSNSNF